jgi:hypothetical protein
MQEPLNIEYHIKKMLVKALNKTDNVSQAAQLLGVSERTAFRMKASYGIKKGSDGLYYIPENKAVITSITKS